MESRTGNVVQYVKNQEFLITLRTFSEMLLTCMGPEGGIKVLISSGGISTTTSLSSRLLNNLVITHPLCGLISQVMKSQIATFGDHGLYTGALTCCLVEKALKQDLMKQSKACLYLQKLFSKVFSILDAEAIKLKLDFNSVKQLLPIVKTILSSKPACGFRRKDISYLSIQIVKVFLTTVNEEFGDVIVVNSDSSADVYIMKNGLLYEIYNDESYVRNVLSKLAEEKDIPLALFNLMLTDTELKRRDEEDILIEKKHNILKEAIIFFEEILRIGVKIVACQRVVHDSIRLYLQRNGVLLLDRLGTELTGAVEKLSGAKPISSLRRMSDECLKYQLGRVDSANLVTYGQKYFVLLESHNANVATLLLHSPSEEAFMEMKAVTHQALAALRQAVCRPLVVPGAGCLEMWLAVLLGTQERTHGTSVDSKCEEAAVGWLQRALLQVGGVYGATANFCSADTVYFHCWRSWDPAEMESCRCGLVTTVQVQAAGGTWVQPNCLAINNTVFASLAEFCPEPKAPSQLHEEAVIDVYSSKCNALKLALDTCVQILNIGLIVHKSCNKI